MSNPSEEPAESDGIGDDQLPEDLRPGDDNPLAKPLEEGEEMEGMSPDTGA